MFIKHNADVAQVYKGIGLKAWLKKPRLLWKFIKGPGKIIVVGDN